jgi:hypothetical protein
MSKINIQGTIDNIRSKSNVYTPIIEAIVNSIEAIEESPNKKKGKITITVIRDKALQFDGMISDIIGFEIQDNGIGFTQTHRDSFDTFYSHVKKSIGGKGFGRFMFIKYFGEVKIESIYKEGNLYRQRKFIFGKDFDIITKETVEEVKAKSTKTTLLLNHLKDVKIIDKGLDTVARKLLERLLNFFVNDHYPCPIIILKEKNKNDGLVILNDYINQKKEIQLLNSFPLSLTSQINGYNETFMMKTFKIYFAGNHKSRISLTAHNREVTESPLSAYIPEFEDDFFDEIVRAEGRIKKNFIIKAYVSGEYLNRNVSLERETFNFDRNTPDSLYPFSQNEIERGVALKVKELFTEEVKVRSEKKVNRIRNYINSSAPWHKVYLEELDLSEFPYNLPDEKIEIELQKIKFNKEIETKSDIQRIMQSGDQEFIEKFQNIVSRITEIGKIDLTHYVANRKVVIDLFHELLKRNEDGKSELEKEIHNLIFPMGKDSTEVNFGEHNLWLLDERLVFSDYVASDRKITSKKTSGEPDIIVFDKKRAYRNGDNEFSNPITLFEFKRPKRVDYKADDDPIIQIGNYLEEIRSGKYETPEGIEKIKVNEYTPVYGYIISDITPKIQEFARNASLTLSPDKEGYFGFHVGFKMYLEIISFKKLLSDANLRNKIFFKKLHIE